MACIWRHFRASSRVRGLQRLRQSALRTGKVFPCRMEEAVSSCHLYCQSSFRISPRQELALGWLRLGRRLASTTRYLTGEYHQHVEQNSGNAETMDNTAALEQFRKHAQEGKRSRGCTAPKLDAIVGDLLHRVPTLSSDELADALALCVKHGFSRHHSLVRCLLRHVPQALEGATDHCLSILTWSVAKLRAREDRLTALLVRKTMECNWSAMNHQMLSRLMWAFVSLGHLPDRLLAVFLEHIPMHLPKCTIPSLTSWVWCAGMETTAIPNSFVERLIMEVMKRPFSMWLYCTVAWTLGRRRQQDVQFYDAMFQRILDKEASKWTPRLVSTMSWSLAASYLYNPDVMGRLADDAIPRLSFFTNHDLANMVYAYGHLNHPCTKLLEAVQSLYIERVRCAGTAIIEDYTLWLTGLNTVWSCTVGDFYPRQLIELFMDRQFLTRTIETRNVEAASTLLQLHIALSVEHPRLGLQGLPQDVFESLVAISMQNASQTHTQSKFHGYVTQAMVQLTGSARAFQPEAHTYSSYIIDFELLVDQNGDPVMPPEGFWLTSSTLPAAMMPTCVVALSSNLGRKKKTSSEGGDQGELELLMSDEWSSAKSEVMPYGSFQGSNNQASTNPPDLSADALNTLITNLRNCHSSEQIKGEVVPSSSPSRSNEPPGRPALNLASDWSPALTRGHIEGYHRVAIEADGPYHFHQSPEGYSLTGSTYLKRRQLAAMGWKVLPLPFYEWHALQSVAEHVEYIRRGLKRLVQNS